MFLLAHPDGRVAVTQPAHAWICGQLARAWGNERFGIVSPPEEVCLAAEQHEIGMSEWDLTPTLDGATGLPTEITSLDLETHLPLRLEGPRRLVAQSRYAALLVSMHHTAFYERPRMAGLVRRRGRRIRSYLEASAAFQAGLRATLDVSDAELERNRQLVRTWDGLSHDILLARAPCTRRAVPAKDGSLELSLSVDRAVHTLDPWPFSRTRVTLRTEGRLLQHVYREQRALDEALASAPWIELVYELVRR